jgi:hypothetical protein
MNILDDKSIVIDHINGNELDTRKCNLRIITQKDNMKNHKLYSNNTSKFDGITKEQTRPGFFCWRARIGCPSGRSKSDYFEKKSFKSLHDSIKWRYEKEKEIFGDLSRNNGKTLEDIIRDIPNEILENGHDILKKCSKCGIEMKNIHKHEPYCGVIYKCPCGKYEHKMETKLKRHLLGEPNKNSDPDKEKPQGCYLKRYIENQVEIRKKTSIENEYGIFLNDKLIQIKKLIEKYNKVA